MHSQCNGKRCKVWDSPGNLITLSWMYLVMFILFSCQALSKLLSIIWCLHASLFSVLRCLFAIFPLCSYQEVHPWITFLFYFCCHLYCWKNHGSTLIPECLADSTSVSCSAHYFIELLVLLELISQFCCSISLNCMVIIFFEVLNKYQKLAISLWMGIQPVKPLFPVRHSQFEAIKSWHQQNLKHGRCGMRMVLRSKKSLWVILGFTPACLLQFLHILFHVEFSW